MPNRLQASIHHRRLPSRRSRRQASQGYALTVFRSPRISRFTMQLVGRLPEIATAGLELILARAGGTTVNTYGGVPYGASGSPVYFRGHLIGAISTTFYPDASLVGITSAAAMLAVAQEKTPESQSIFPATAAPAPARITAIGLTSGRALGEVSNRFGPPLLGGGGMSLIQNNRPPRLQPGSPVGAALMIGDIKLGFIGTATIVDRNQVFAFGHPLLFSGPTSLALTTAEIADTARGDQPNKVGSLGEMIGTVVQDRAAGIYAKLGQMPQLIGMKFSIMDEDRRQTTTVRTQAAPVPSELAFLTYIATAESMQRAMNRVGAGSAFWDWSIWEAGAERPTTISGSGYDAYDIGSVVASSALSTLEQLVQSATPVSSLELTATVTIQKLPEVDEN